MLLPGAGAEEMNGEVCASELRAVLRHFLLSLTVKCHFLDALPCSVSAFFCHF